MTLYLRKLKFSESYPFKCQGKRYYYDIQTENTLLKLQLDLDIKHEIINTLREEQNIKYHTKMYQQFIENLTIKTN